ncbi:MAG: hypothetical protein K0Q49_2532 [Haloplasmataceae bacterium]|jgi:hypothetical protein|nr:hypothetical protein [Haloplasmataceae bacterium]
MGLSPVFAILGFIVFVLFFSNFYNFLDANHLEKSLMDSRHRFIYVLSKFVVITFVIIASMASIGHYFTFIPNWLFFGISILLFMSYIYVSILKLVWDIFEKIPAKIENIIDKKRNILKFVLLLLLFASIVVVSGYVFKMSKEVAINSGVGSFDFIVIGIIFFSLLLSGWLFSIIGLLNYKKKAVQIEIDKIQYEVEKVLFNGKIQLRPLNEDNRIIVSVDALEMHKITIV